MRKPSGSIRCRLQPVLAASRMTLPVLGGISGCTSTMWNIARCPFSRPVPACAPAPRRRHGPRRRGAAPRAASRSCGAGGHHVVDQGQMLAVQRYAAGAGRGTKAPRRLRAALRAAVRPGAAPAAVDRSSRAWAGSRARVRPARQLPGLVVAALGQALRRQRHRQHPVRQRARRRGRTALEQPLRQRRGQLDAAVNLKSAISRSQGKRVVDSATVRLEGGRVGAGRRRMPVPRRPCAGRSAGSVAPAARSATRSLRTRAPRHPSCGTPRTGPSAAAARPCCRAVRRGYASAQYTARPWLTAAPPAIPAPGRRPEALDRIARRLAPAGAAALAARRGGAPHGRTAGRDPPAAELGGRLVAASSGGSAGAAAQAYPQARLLAVEADAALREREPPGAASALVVAAALGRRRRSAARRRRRWRLARRRAAVGQHGAAPGRRPAGAAAAWHRALAVDGFLMFSTPGPGHAARPARLYAAAGLAGRRSRPSSTCTTWATCWCRPVLPTR